MTTRKRRTHSTGGAKAKRRRNPPKGFRTWKAYMASIRPGAKKRARSNPTGGTTMAAKRKRRKATHHKAARRNPALAHQSSNPPRRRRHRRNPPSVLKTLPSFVGGVLVGALSTTVGTGVARAGRGLLRMDGTSVVGMATEALIGIAAGIGIAMAGFHQIGRDVAVGGVQSPVRSGVTKILPAKAAALLGADDYYLGFSDGVDIAGANLGGYVQGERQLGELGDVGELGATPSGARFVAGPRAA